jgi:photosystem II stability/assembly factor-like uncharacterized protein
VCLLLALMCEKITAQSFRNNHAEYALSSNFYDIVNRADSYFTTQEEISYEGFEDDEYMRFKRWQWYWQTRVNDDGRFPDLIAQHRVYRQLQQSASRDVSSPWVNINQSHGDGGYNGMGRATSIAFHPTDPQIFYVGAPIGGIWKTTDGGLTYSALGDSLPYVSVGNICTHPTDPNIIYITVGDSNGWWNYGLGVYKSIDGGETWQPTTNTSLFTQNVAYLRMVINPANPDELFVAQTNGLFRTQDGGMSWDVVHTGSHSDVELKTGANGELYCATDDYWGSSEVFTSLDHGTSWSQISDFNAAYNYLQISVTPAEQEYLGIKSSISGAADYYATYDGGINVSHIDLMPDDGILFTSPLNSSKIYCGFMVTHQSINGGLDWNQLTDWYNSGNYTEVHADNHYVAHHPLTNELYFCNDGGVYRFNESAMQWTELTAGLIITQYYRIAVAQSDDVFMIGGTQDNGGRKRTGVNAWAATNGGDGMEVAINPVNENIIYTTYVNGQLYRSNDQWVNDTYNEITPPDAGEGDWVTPYVLDPQDPAVVVAGYSDVFRSDDNGETWQQLSTNLTSDPGNKIKAIAVAPSDQYTIYAGRAGTMYITRDAGETWDNQLIALGLGNSAELTSIAVHPTDPMQLWVTLSGYSSTKKVYYSSNGGDTFTNITHNLPNVPCNASVIDVQSELLDLYVGTDVGVFVYDAAGQQWIYYGAGLPNTSVTDLEIQYNTRKLRIGTFGRGVWENDLYSQPFVASVSSTSSLDKTTFRLNNNPADYALIIDVHAGKSAQGAWVVYDMQGREVVNELRSLPVGHYQLVLDIEHLAPGAYILKYAAENHQPEGIHFIKR